MSKQVLISILDEASKAGSSDEKFKLVGVAAEYVRDNPHAEYGQDASQLNYVLRWMVKHRKFPTVVVTPVRRQVPLEGFDRDAVRRKFFGEMAENPPASTRSVDSLWQTYLRRAQAEFRKSLPQDKLTRTHYVFKLGYAERVVKKIASKKKLALSETPPMEQILPMDAFGVGYGYVQKLQSWDKVLEFLGKLLASKYRWFSLEEG